MIGCFNYVAFEWFVGHPSPEEHKVAWIERGLATKVLEWLPSYRWES